MGSSSVHSGSGEKDFMKKTSEILNISEVSEKPYGWQMDGSGQVLAIGCVTQRTAWLNLPLPVRDGAK